MEARKRLIDEKKDVSDVLNELLVAWLKLYKCKTIEFYNFILIELIFYS